MRSACSAGECVNSSSWNRRVSTPEQAQYTRTKRNNLENENKLLQI